MFTPFAEGLEQRNVPWPRPRVQGPEHGAHPSTPLCARSCNASFTPLGVGTATVRDCPGKDPPTAPGWLATQKLGNPDAGFSSFLILIAVK